MEFAGIGLYRYAFDGTVQFMDLGALRILEIDDVFPDPLAVVGKNVAELVIYMRPPGVLREEVRAKRSVRGIEYPFKTLKGNEKWAVHDSYLCRNPKTGEESIQVLIRDITSQKQVEDALRQSELKYRALFETPRDALFLGSGEGVVLDCNAAACRMFGYAKEELVGRAVAELVPEEVAQALPDLVSDSRTPEGLVMETMSKRRDGSLFPTEVNARFCRIDGKRMVVVYARDITVRKRTQEALAQSAQINERLRALLITMNACRTLEDMLDPLLETAIAVSDMDAGAVYLVEGENAVMHCRRGFPENAVQEVAFLPMASGAVASIRAQDRPAYLNEAAPDMAARFHGCGMRHVYAAPLHAEEGVFGFLLTATRRDEAADHSSANRLAVIALEATSLFSRLRAQEALRKSEERYRNILESIQEGYYEVDLAGNMTFFNKALCRVLGYSESELMGRNYRSYYGDQDHIAKVYKTFNEVYRTGNPIQVLDWQIVKADGSKATVGVSISLMRDHKGSPVGFRGIARDITERKQAEEALRQAEARNRALLNAIPDTLLRVRADGTCLYFKPDWVAPPPSWPYGAVVGMKLSEIVPADVAERSMEHVSRALETGAMQSFEFHLTWETGVHQYEARLVACGKDEVLILVRDITDRKRAENALRESEEQYRDLFENANDLIYTHDLSGRFTSLNKAAEQITGYTEEEACAFDSFDIVAPEYRELAQDMVSRKLVGEEATRYEIEVIAKDGHRVPLELSSRLILKDGKPIGVQGIGRDITERRRAEQEQARFQAQIQHAQKLESLGVLTGGIAHDFNNLLVGILGNAGLARARLPFDSAARPYMDKIEATARRAGDLTNQMLAYSGKGTFMVQPIHLSKLAEEMARLLEASISKKAVLRYDFAPDLPLIQGDTTQLQQVIMNLITNASDALGDEVGAITLRTSVMDADRAYLSATYLDDELPEGWYVILEVSDTGCGMAPETQARIFDPFFSTKFAGRGLGLAAVLGIIRSHRGAIRVYSEPGRGSSFKVLLPAARGSATNARARLPRARLSGHAAFGPDADEILLWHGSGVVLVADDEEDVRAVAQDTLEQHGFTIVTAKNGKEAVEAFRSHANELVAVLLDLTMPMMNGEEAFEKFRGIRVGVPVILSSGYTEQGATAHFAGEKPTAFVQKPYSPETLLRALRGVLEKA
jgi:PAS domain S-box-containing protein